MFITARINGGRAELMAIQQLGLSAKTVRGGLIIELRTEKKIQATDRDHYVLPELLKNARLFIDVVEWGGKSSENGCGTVVCGLRGSQLRPYYTSKESYVKPCGVHAHFAVPLTVVTVTCSSVNVILIEVHKIYYTRTIAWIGSQIIWSGRFENIPQKHAQFRLAAEAAMAKANCPNCVCVHFAEPLEVFQKLHRAARAAYHQRKRVEYENCG
ncbi:MAG: hypothetical protein WCK11_03695 [Candidatus Falkowbacteria bacterium]